MIETLNMREAVASDAGDIAALIQCVAGYFLTEPSGKGAEGFLASITQQAITSYIANPGFIYLAGFLGPRLAGVAALRDGKHVYHLFVHPDFHRQGIAQALWHQLRATALANGSERTFTVNSSLYAVPVYAAFGFVASAEPLVKNGIQYQAMQLAHFD
jgi:GNAT superfamily N-acetyltransferase